MTTIKSDRTSKVLPEISKMLKSYYPLVIDLIILDIPKPIKKFRSCPEKIAEIDVEL